jgi:hypothetical protein
MQQHAATYLWLLKLGSCGVSAKHRPLEPLFLPAIVAGLDVLVNPAPDRCSLDRG